jgi:hypothetical protein
MTTQRTWVNKGLCVGSFEARDVQYVWDVSLVKVFRELHLFLFLNFIVAC